MGAAESFQRAGGKIGVEDTSVPFGGVDFTAEAVDRQRERRERHPSDDGRRLGLRSHDGRSSKRAVKLKACSVVGGLRAGRHQLPAWSSLQGAYFLSLTRPSHWPQCGAPSRWPPPSRSMNTSPRVSSPVYGQNLSWLGCDLMINGLQRAGQNPTRAGVIKALRQHQVLQRQRAATNHITSRQSSGHDLPQCAGSYGPTSQASCRFSSKPVCGTDYPARGTRQARRTPKRGSRRRRLEGRSDSKSPPTDV